MANTGPEQRNARQWVAILARYAVPNAKRSLFELFVSAVPLLLFWVLTLYCVQHYGFLVSLLAAIPAGGFLMRLFVIQHDCGHGSFFSQRSANDWTGRLLGVVTLIPYDYWRRTHAIHHATTGNLDRRGFGDVSLLTVAEYRALPRLQRVGYRLSRNPYVLLVLGPLYLFIFKYRLPVGLMREGKLGWISAMSTNLLSLCAAVGLCSLVGVWDFVLVQLPMTLIAGSAGVWLFYVQHQFEGTYWERQPEWSLHAAALQGSSHCDLPPLLRWMTGNIGIHHVHHLASKIPGYRLGEVLDDHPELRHVGRLTLREGFACFRLALWDDATRRLIAFRDLRRVREGYEAVGS